MNSISVIYVVRDNPSHFIESLESVQFANEIVVVDIGMTDQCKKAIQQFPNLKIIQYDAEVRYVEQIREKTKSYAKNEYILFMDPDEVIPEKLKEELLKRYEKYDYLSIPRKNEIFGKWIAHSRWWPDYQVRLFKKNATHWSKKLHAQPDVEGDGTFIDSQEDLAMIHYNYENLTEYLGKMVRYAESEAQEIVARNGKYTLVQVIRESLQEFMSRFFSERGCKDGTHGFALASLQLMYKWLVFLYVWEKNSYPQNTEKELVDATQLFFQDGLRETNHWCNEEKFSTGSQAIKQKIVNKLLT